jgi:NTP pyrophosphatase (non-canonical NTP hydrolase)
MANDNWPPIANGTRVRTAKKLDARDYTEAGQADRRSNAVGRVVDYHTGHGLCYSVAYESPSPNGPSHGTFDPDELTAIAGGSGDFSIGSDFWPGISKLVEEAGEVLQVCGKLIASRGIAEHWDGTNLRELLQNEIADVIAACAFVVDKNGLDQGAIEARVKAKLERFERWHTLPDGNNIDQQRCPVCTNPMDADDGCLRCKKKGL